MRPTLRQHANTIDRKRVDPAERLRPPKHRHQDRHFKIRRAVRHGNKLGAQESFFHKLVAPLAKEMGDVSGMRLGKEFSQVRESAAPDQTPSSIE